MLVAKHDLTTILVLSIAFFVMSTWALGKYDVPLSTWQPNGGEISDNMVAVYVVYSFSYVFYSAPSQDSRGEVTVHSLQ